MLVSVSPSGRGVCRLLLTGASHHSSPTGSRNRWPTKTAGSELPVIWAAPPRRASLAEAASCRSQTVDKVKNVFCVNHFPPTDGRWGLKCV